MKNMVKISVLIMILITGISSLNMNAQRGRGMVRSLNDSTGIRKDSMNLPGRRQMMMNYYSREGHMPNIDGRMHNMGPRMRNRFDGRMAPGYGYRGMRQPLYGYAQDRPGMDGGLWMGEAMYNAPGRRIIESMPGVTSKQKEELEAINKQQLEEMQKLREKHQEAIRELRDNHRKRVIGLLTDEQKKWMEENPSRAR